MLKTVLTIGLAALAIASASQQEQSPQRSAARESRTRSVYVSVLDKSDAPVAGLQ